MERDKSLLRVGQVGGAYGIKGWLKVSSFTDPEDNLFSYLPWQLRDPTGRRAALKASPLEAKQHGKAWVVRFENIADRDAAESLKGLEILVARDLFPEAEQGHYYWADLEGLRVEQLDGTVLGRVDHLLDTGATDVLVIVGEDTDKRCLVPFVMGTTVHEVNLGEGVIKVDWATQD